MKKRMYVSNVYTAKKLSGLYLTIGLMVILSAGSCVTNHKYNAIKLSESKAKSENTKLIGDLKTLQSTNADLENRNSTCESKVIKMDGEIGQLSNINQSTNKELKLNKDQVIAQHKRLVDLQNKIELQQKYTEALREKISNALVSFKSDELMVSVKNGKVYVSMQEGLLFPSGSAQINNKGKEALLKVAEVLKDNLDINVNIEGHTDTVNIHTKLYADNWALSTARATSIAHVMIDEYAVLPERITASGRSQYSPVSENSTSDGRRLNRRTEIILEPKLNELMDLIYNVPAIVSKDKNK